MPVLGMAVFGVACAAVGGVCVAFIDNQLIRDLRECNRRQARTLRQIARTEARR